MIRRVIRGAWLGAWVGLIVAISGILAGLSAAIIAILVNGGVGLLFTARSGAFLLLVLLGVAALLALLVVPFTFVFAVSRAFNPGNERGATAAADLKTGFSLRKFWLRDAGAPLLGFGALLAGFFCLGPPPSVNPALAIGQPVALKGPTLRGPEFDLAQYRGKVVLVDFWATWCGPCVGELPDVRKVYDRHHGEGFEVVGVSLDEKRSALEQFVAAEQIPWEQIFVDREGERGWMTPMAQKYQITAIPATLLVDREGKLAASNLRGRALEPAVVESLGGRRGPTPVSPVVLPPRLYWSALALLFVGGTFLGAIVEAWIRGRRSRAEHVLVDSAGVST